VIEGHEIQNSDFQRVKYAGYLTLSQSGEGNSLLSGVRSAVQHGITCINVVNVEGSPLTKVISDLSESLQDQWFESESIGLFMKSGFCYSDVKSFIPEVIAMALVALWFSSNKSSTADKQIKLRRQSLVQ
jgi:fructoselysine-6-P-deglycase FrlB-like protein